jgi:hypothetical protein
MLRLDGGNGPAHRAALREDEFAALGRAQAYDLEQSPVSMLDGPLYEIMDRWPW